MSPDIEDKDIGGEIKDLASFIFANGDARMMTRAMLCHIFHHALHGRFYEARDLLLMSHIADRPESTDIATQILFNRTITQIGLCAFRMGLYSEAKDCLSRICERNKHRELLAQGRRNNVRWHDRDQAQERRRRGVDTFHQHINTELIDAVS